MFRRYIHLTGNFLYWHRMFVWTFEQTLRNECGYQGYLPYWNYAKTSEDLLNSPMYVPDSTKLDLVLIKFPASMEVTRPSVGTATL